MLAMLFAGGLASLSHAGGTKNNAFTAEVYNPIQANGKRKLTSSYVLQTGLQQNTTTASWGCPLPLVPISNVINNARSNSTYQEVDTTFQGCGKES
ncbi:MAG TPA: hypothetical protein VNI01_15380 [Elusimicrobiota bacterium]|jgi:hypothetical protein|nr:hypothetical protein [Elusimicrobiota bacterium]